MKRKTISGDDVLKAMDEMEFERFVEPLKSSLKGDCYRGVKKNSVYTHMCVCVCIQYCIFFGLQRFILSVNF